MASPRRAVCALGLLCAALLAPALLLASPAETARVTPPRGTIVFGRGDVDTVCAGTLWEIGTDGAGARKLVDSGSGECDPDLSPDGTKLAFASLRAGDGSIWVANADGSGARQVSRGPEDFQPAWSPDGKRIAFERSIGDSDWELFVMNADGSGVRRISGGTDFDGTPDWNRAQGDLVIASSGKEGLGATAIRCSCSALYRLRPDGSGVRRITGRRVDSLLPQWSPDGSRIAWARKGKGDDYALAVMNADTTGLRILDPVGEDAGWSPDGSWIAYSHDGSLYLIRPDGTGRTRLTSGFFADAPQWRP